MIRLLKHRAFCTLAIAALGLFLGRAQAWAMGEYATLAFPYEKAPLSAVIDSTKTYAYFGTDDATGTIVQVRLSDFTQILSTYTLFSGGQFTSGVIDSVNNFVYFGNNSGDGTITRARIPTFNSFSLLSLNAGEDGLTSAIIDGGNGNAYFGTNTAPGKIVKIRLSSFTRNAGLTLNAGEDYLSCGVIDVNSGIAYFGTNTSPAKVIKIDLASFTRVGAITLLSGESGLTSCAISPASDYVYFGTNTSPGKVIKIRISDFTERPSYTLLSGENGITAMTITSSGDYLYMGTDQTPATVVRFRLNDFVEESTSTLTLPSLRAAVIDTASYFAYFASSSTPGGIDKFDFKDTRTGPPLMTGQPRSTKVPLGAPASFSVTTVGSSPFTYQWRKNGTDILGATEQVYQTPGTTFDDNSSVYNCVISNVFGSKDSSAAVLTVMPVIKVFPNPWRVDLHNGFPVTFQGTAPNTTLKIFTLSQHWMKTMTGGGTITWDLTNDAGQRAASGYYFYLATTPDSEQTVHGKFAIIQ